VYQVRGSDAPTFGCWALKLLIAPRYGLLTNPGRDTETGMITSYGPRFSSSRGVFISAARALVKGVGVHDFSFEGRANLTQVVVCQLLSHD